MRQRTGRSMYRRRFNVYGCLAGLAALALAGCQSGTLGGSNAGRITARPIPYISDVPVPTGFKLVDKMTDDYVSGGVRVVRHEYEGRADRAALRNFYQEQMPTYRWARISDQNIKGEITLRFEKANESCTVVIRPTNSDWFDQSSIRVTIVPFDRSGREPPARVPAR
jgi:hypothetical protein